MAGQSPLSATDEQRAALTALAGSRDRGEADRARAVLLTLAGWTSSHIAEAFGVRDDTVRLWSSDFMRDGVAALKGMVAPGPAPVKGEASLRVVMPLLRGAVGDRPSWTIPRLRAEIEAQAGVCISRAQLSKALRQKNSAGEMMRLEVAPNGLDVVQFRSVSGQPLDGEPMGAGGECGEGELAGVDRAIVLDQHDGREGLSGPRTIEPVELLEMGDEIAAALGR